MENKVIQIPVGSQSYPTNCYLIYDEDKQAVLVDPGYDKEAIIRKIQENGLVVDTIFLTHCHGDHIGQVEAMQQYTGANVVIHEKDVDGLTDDEKSHFDELKVTPPSIPKEKWCVMREEQLSLQVGKMSFVLYHTPGHTSGSIVIYEKNSKLLLTGDTLFAEYYGRVDLKSGSMEEMKNSLDFLFTTFNNITIYPGHEKTAIIESTKRRVRLLLKIRGLM